MAAIRRAAGLSPAAHNAFSCDNLVSMTYFGAGLVGSFGVIAAARSVLFWS